MPRPRHVIAVFAAVMALASAACGGSSGDHAGDDHATLESVNEPVDGAEEVTITAADIDYRPERLELKAGEPTNVTVVNEGESLHDFTLKEADVHMNVDPGDEATTSVVVDSAGQFKAICSVPGHADAGMVVQVSVTQ
ncbi:MAG: hypothetical protein GEU74_05850 [Nitriliruptorales bacterium]|nr:hypothetical protein [Nitriliruptorales bacterium]